MKSELDIIVPAQNRNSTSHSYHHPHGAYPSLRLVVQKRGTSIVGAQKRGWGRMGALIQFTFEINPGVTLNIG